MSNDLPYTEEYDPCLGNDVPVEFLISAANTRNTDKSLLSLVPAPADWRFELAPIFQLLGYYKDSEDDDATQDKLEELIRSIFYTHRAPSRSKVAKLLPLVISMKVPVNVEAHLWHLVIADVYSVVTWVAMNNQKALRLDANLDMNEQLPSVKELQHIATELFVECLGISMEKDDDYEKDMVLHKFPQNYKGYPLWRLSCLEKFAQFGKLDVIQNEVTSKARPKASASVHSAIQLSFSDMTGVYTPLALSDLGEVKCGYSAWKRVTDIYENEHTLQAQYLFFENALKSLKPNGGSLLKYCMNFISHMNAIKYVLNICKEKAVTVTGEYIKYGEAEWNQEIYTALSSSKYKSNLVEAKERTMDKETGVFPLHKFVAYLIKKNISDNPNEDRMDVERFFEDSSPGDKMKAIVKAIEGLKGHIGQGSGAVDQNKYVLKSALKTAVKNSDLDEGGKSAVHAMIAETSSPKSEDAKPNSKKRARGGKQGGGNHKRNRTNKKSGAGEGAAKQG